MRFLSTQHGILDDLNRKWGRFFDKTSPQKLMNVGIGGIHFATKSEKVWAMPSGLKIDISPLCNLHCTACLHAHPNGNETLEKQVFKAEHKMTLSQFERVINEIKGKTSLVTLHYFGDPYTHPHVDEMCRIASDAGLNTHINTNFNFAFTDDRIKQIVQSGLTHLTVCVDGLSQENYQLTRVGGRIKTVLSNLKRVCSFKREYGQAYPKVEVQYLKFQHNIDELEKATQIFQEIGVDQMTNYWGMLSNYSDNDLGKYNIFEPRKKKLLPRCLWPYFDLVIRYNGDVIPCCNNHRNGLQHTTTGDPLVLGNIFETSIYDVWNSAKYQKLRRFVSNPELVKLETELKETFCYGCNKLFDNDRSKNYKCAKDYKFEDLYTISQNGIPIPKDSVGCAQN
ncbi:MAG: SPASM domain-containing protein [Prochloraceae cyanobacterium]|nr:SPASM domain-containing protein [Prochloraceae cyanobacterium]